MSPINDSNNTDSLDNTLVVIKGGTDNTTIGNVGDRIKVDAVATAANNELATFILYVPAAGVATGKSMASIVNTTGSTVRIKIRQIKIINVQNTAVTGTINNFEFRRITSHSSGTLLTANAHDTVDTLSASVTCRTGATITGEAALLYRYLWSGDEWGVGAIDNESQDHTFNSLVPVYVSANYSKPITLNANEGFHIKHTTSSSVGTFDIEILFTQE